MHGRLFALAIASPEFAWGYFVFFFFAPRRVRRQGAAWARAEDGHLRLARGRRAGLSGIEHDEVRGETRVREAARRASASAAARELTRSKRLERKVPHSASLRWRLVARRLFNATIE